MKNLLKKTGLIVLLTTLMILLGACQKEVESVYLYTMEVKSITDEESLESPAVKSTLEVINDYMTSIGMFRSEDFDNDGKNNADAVAKNDAEAVMEFNNRSLLFNKDVVISKIKTARYTSASVDINYVLYRDGGTRVATKNIKFSFLKKKLNFAGLFGGVKALKRLVK